MIPHVISYADRATQARAVADVIAAQLAEVLTQQGQATLAVPGGTSPAPVFEHLSRADLDWARVTVVLGDERWVDGDDPRSNTRLLRQHLFQNNAAVAQYVDLYTGDVTPDLATHALQLRLAPHWPLTVALLGMGQDMHTASLFPGADHLRAAMADEAPAVMAIRAAGAQEPRITLTRPILAGARHIHVLIMGMEKHQALMQAAELDPMQAPIRAFLDQAIVHWAA